METTPNDERPNEEQEQEVPPPNDEVDGDEQGEPDDEVREGFAAPEE